MAVVYRLDARKKELTSKEYLAKFGGRINSQSIMPSCLTGPLNSLNKNAIDWHDSGLLVYACHNTLVFIDVATQRVFQTLTKHYAPITRVRWQPSKSFSNSDLTLRCASADSSGHILVWDVISGRVSAKFFSQNHAVYEMRWLEYGDTSCDFLLTLNSKTLLILWNINSNEPMWQSRLGFNALGFSIDPFNSNNVTFNSNGSRLVFVNDLKPSRQLNSQPTLLDLRENDQNTESSIQQLTYHRAYPNLIFALFKDQLMCINSAMKQIIYNIRLSHPLLTLLPCGDRDAFYTVQLNGLVAFYVASFRSNSTTELPALELTYDRTCCTEVLRGSSKFSVSAAAICPVYQTHVSLLYNTGKLLFYQLQSDLSPTLTQHYRLHTVSDHIRLDDNLDQHYNTLRLRQAYQINSLSANVTALRMRPMSSIDDSMSEFGTTQLAAVGTANGTVHLVDVFTCKIVRSFQIHSNAIKCVEWTGNLIISASSSSSLASTSSTYKNELFACDIQTGQKQRIRPEADESSIELFRVSSSGRYLAIVFRHDPLEIWDLHSMKLLRKMSKKCPIIVDMVWFGKKKDEGELNVARENLVILDVDNRLYHVVIKGIHVRDGKEVNTEWKNNSTILRLAYKQELLVFGDSNGRLRVWDLVKKQSRQTSASQSNYGPVARLAFTTLGGDNTIAVQHPSAVTVWDVDNLQLLQLINSPGLTVVDCDMSGVSPVYVLSDGAVRFSNSTSNEMCAPVPDSEVPLLLNEGYQKAVLKFAQDPTKTLNDCDYSSQGDTLAGIFTNLSNIETIQSRLETAYSFLGLRMAADLMQVTNAVLNDQRLNCRLWMFWPRDAFRKRLERGTKILMKCCKTTQHVDLLTEKAIVLGQRDWATYLLLNFEHEQSENRETRLNAFKACLLAANLGGEEAQCLVKLTATNLIASDFISDGVQLLYLINQELDACRYLAAQGDWSRSFSYSKLLPNNDGQEIFSKFIQHLTFVEGTKSLIILLHASFKDWEKCARLLREQHQEEVANNLQLVLEQTSPE